MEPCILCLCDEPPTNIYKGICNCHPPIHTECINEWYNVNPNTCPICLIKFHRINRTNQIQIFAFICFLYCMFLFWGPILLIWVVIGIYHPGYVHHHHHKNITSGN